MSSADPVFPVSRVDRLSDACGISLSEFVFRLADFAVSFRFSGKSDSGEFVARSITSGGAPGRRYRPRANAAITMIAMTASGRAKLVFPNRRAQSSHRLPFSQARQPFLFRRAPHSAQ